MRFIELHIDGNPVRLSVNQIVSVRVSDIGIEVEVSTGLIYCVDESYDEVCDML